MKHAYCFSIVTIASCALLFSGCARLNVNVDVLNSAFWVSPPYLDNITLTKISVTDQAILNGRFARDCAALKKSVGEGLLQMSKERPPKVSPSQVAILIPDYEKIIDESYNKAQAKFQEAFDKARKASPAACEEEQIYQIVGEAMKETCERSANQAMREAKNLYAGGSSIMANLIKELETDLRTNLCLSTEDTWPLAMQPFVKNVQSIKASGLIGGAGILDDPRAASVVYAPPEHWKGSFNQTVCNGWFGNTDCAVKMEGLGDFTLKGVRLDATKITQATFSVARQAIQVVAAVYGVPVPKSQPTPTATGSQGNEVQAPLEMTSPVKRQRDAETAVMQFRLARLAMFEVIVAQSQAIRDDSRREQAIKTIKAVLDANCKQLDQDSTQ
jgi:hypothetical protein